MSLLDDAYALIFGADRSIGTFAPDITIREGHRDVMAVTTHPVEGGTPISDHAFLLPKQCEMIVGCSDSSAGSAGASREAYDEVLAIMRKREPVDVYTGKRPYQNMIPVDIAVTTDEKTEHALFATIRLQEVIIVHTRATTPTGAQASPQTTGSVQDRGTVTPQPTSSVSFDERGGVPTPIPLGIGTAPGRGAFGLGGATA